MFPENEKLEAEMPSSHSRDENYQRG